MPTPEQVRAAAEGYVEGYVKGPSQRAEYVALFADDATQIDPVGTDPHVGQAAIGAFFDNVFTIFERVDFEIRNLFVCGDEAAMEFTITGHKAEGGGAAFDGVDWFKVNDDGKITAVKGFSDPTKFRPFD